MTEENHEKTTVRLVGTGIRTRDLPNASLMHYHGATSLGRVEIYLYSFPLYPVWARWPKGKALGYWLDGPGSIMGVEEQRLTSLLRVQTGPGVH